MQVGSHNAPGQAKSSEELMLGYRIFNFLRVRIRTREQRTSKALLLPVELHATVLLFTFYNTI